MIPRDYAATTRTETVDQVLLAGSYHSSLERKPELPFPPATSTGRRQASCRINGFIYAASFMVFCGLKFLSPLVSILSGFRCTISMRRQFRVARFQRSGFLARAIA